MKQISLMSDAISLTTVEIAELTGKRHDHVKRDSKYMLLELYGNDPLPKFGESFKADNGHFYECYRLPKTEILILVSGYSIKLRAAIIRRLEELEKNTIIPDFNNPVKAARAWADEMELKLLAEKKAKQLEYINTKNKPKVESYNRFIDSDGVYTLRGAFKMLNLKPNIYTAILREDKILYYLQRQNVPMQKYIDDGYFVVNVHKNGKNGKTYTQTYVTPEGLSWLRKKYK